MTADKTGPLGAGSSADSADQSAGSTARAAGSTARATGSTAQAAPHGAKSAPLEVIGNLIRGALIGLAELVPGVSGGTVALVTGIYERALAQGSALIDIVRNGVRGPNRGQAVRGGLTKLDWLLLVPVAIGMVGIVVTLAGVMQSFVEDQREIAYGLFFGMVAASVMVPLTMARASRPESGAWKGVAFLVLGLAAGFGLSSLPLGDTSDPAPWLIFIAASIAVCALVLPGVSGSYLLLAMGLYSTTVGAVADRNISYLVIFAAGALAGLVAFVKILDYLLTHKRFATLMVMSGLMVGSLRALWPWQTEDGDLLAVGDDWPTIVAFVALGAGIVFGVLAIERAIRPGEQYHEFHPTEPDFHPEDRRHPATSRASAGEAAGPSASVQAGDDRRAEEGGVPGR